MPVPNRTPYKLLLRGVNLSDPIDALPPGDYPFMVNCRSLEQGGVDCRPGQSQVFPDAMADLQVHSIRSLNDITGPALYDLLLGAGTNLYGQGGGADPVLLDSGYSGNPLSMIRWRPDQSPSARMYVGDANRMSRVNITTGVRQNMGIAPPTMAPTTELNSNLYVAIQDTESATGWSATGTAAAIALGSRVSTTIAQILFDDAIAARGFATISPASTDNHWLETGARIFIAATEHQTVDQVLPPIDSTTIAGIVYDSGATGLCTIVLVGLSRGVDRNSLIQIGGETIRVLSVSESPEGQFSLRCSTSGSFAAGNAVTGIPSFRLATNSTYAIGTALTSGLIQWTVATGTGLIQKAFPVDLSFIRPGKPTQVDDYIHISINVDVPANVISGRLLLDVDATTNDFTHNYYQYQFFSDPFVTAGASQWVEIFIRVGDLQKIGSDPTRTLANVVEVGIELTVSGNVTAQFSAWWLGGAYGPDVIQGQIEGLVYRYRYRDSTTGAKSVPGPATRYGLFPARQQVSVKVTASTDPQVDTIDIERLDPILQAPAPAGPTFTYVGSISNSASPLTFQDNVSAENLTSSPPLETNVFQPFPTLGLPLSGTVNVVGTSVQWVSGSLFPLNLIAGTVILINGVAHQVRGQPSSATALALEQSAGVQNGVSYLIASPTLAGMPLPFIFGPLEGPSAAFVFGIGDVKNPGLLYWTNGNDPDSAADSNFIEVTSPSEPLVSGAVWNGYVFVFSRDRIFLVQPTFDQPNLFTPIQLPSASGAWTPWTVAAGIDGVHFLGRDGLYVCRPYIGAQPTALDLWPLFPHEGNPGITINGLLAVQMPSTSPSSNQLALSVCEQDVYFDYIDSSGARRTMVYSPVNDENQQPRRGWRPYQYGFPVTRHYFEEVPFGQTPRLLQLTNEGLVMASGGQADGAIPIVAQLQLPILNSDDSRAQKLYVDCITDMIGNATMQLGFNFNSIPLGATNISAAPRGQAISIIDSILMAPGVTSGPAAISLPIFINITALYTFGPGTSLYEFQPSFYPQPYLIENIVTQFKDHGLAGWKTTRFARFAYISLTPLSLVISTSEGGNFQYTLPAHPNILNTFEFNVNQLQKGRLFAYDLRAPDCLPFVLFPEETYVKMKLWKDNGEFAEVRVFTD